MLSIFNNKIVIFIIIILTLYIIIYVVSKIECKLSKISVFNVKNNKNSDKIRIVFLSDFHNKKFKNDYKDLIDNIISSNPDYIVFGGDFVDFSTLHSKKNDVKYKRTLLFIKKLGEKFKELKNLNNYNLKSIYFGFGNHELRLKSRVDNPKLVAIYNEFISTLKDNDIKLLEDNTYKLSDGITLSGLNLYEGYYNNLFEKKNIFEHIESEIINKSFKDIDKKKFNIMVFHKPDYCEDLIDYGFDLVLSGHNHGGLINFPIIGPIFSPDMKLFPKYNCGHYIYKDKSVIISEICVININ